MQFGQTQTTTFVDTQDALCYMVECTMASLEKMKMIKRTPKLEIARHESIIQNGLRACHDNSLMPVAVRTKCPRVVQALQEADLRGQL